MKRAQRTEPVKVNKPGIVLLAVIAHIVGYAPVVLLIQRPVIMVYIIVGAALISIIGVRKFTSRATETPNLAEFLLGGLEAVQMPAFIGLIWMAIYGIVFGIVQLIQILINLFGGQLVIDAGGIAFYPTVILGGLITAVVSTYPIDEVVKKLYPDVAGIRSAYFKFFSTNRSKLIGAAIGSFVILLILVTLLTFHILNQYLIYVLLQFTFFIVGGLFAPETRIERTEKKKRLDVVERIKMLLEKVGYITEINPRTEDAAIDPLLINVDIFARRENHNLLLDIKSPVDVDKTVDWKSASTLMQSAYLLSMEKDIKDLDARLLLVDIEPDSSLKKMSKRNDIPLISFSSEEIDKILEIDNREEQQQAIRSLLKLSPEGAAPDRAQHLSRN